MIAELREASLTRPLSLCRPPPRARSTSPRPTRNSPASIAYLSWPHIASRGPPGRSGRDTTRARHGPCRLTPPHHDSWPGSRRPPAKSRPTRCRDPHRPTSRPERATARQPVIGRMAAALARPSFLAPRNFAQLGPASRNARQAGQSVGDQRRRRDGQRFCALTTRMRPRTGLESVPVRWRRRGPEAATSRPQSRRLLHRRRRSVDRLFCFRAWLAVSGSWRLSQLGGLAAGYQDR